MSGEIKHATAARQGQKPFAFNPRAAAFMTRPGSLLNLIPLAASYELKHTQTASVAVPPTTGRPSLPWGGFQLNPQATVFSPALKLIQLSGPKPKAATFSPGLPMPLSALNPLAPTFYPICTSTKHSKLDPQAVAWSPSLPYTSQPLNHLILASLPAGTPSSVCAATEATTEGTEQRKSASSISEERSNFEVGPCTREVLEVSADRECVKASGLLCADQHLDLSFCNIPSIADDIEYKNQKMQMQQDPEIHHFNWFGNGVLTKTSTPAAVSLAVIMMSGPAGYIDGENIRDQTILREAMVTIDPVVYYGNINELQNLKGERLREAAVGGTAILYSPFGSWKNDVYGENEERPISDDFDMMRYIEGNTIINGWLGTVVPSRQDFLDDAMESYYSALDARRKRVRDRMLFGVGTTPLRSVVTANGLKLEIAAKQHPLADASGLTIAAMLCSSGTKASSAIPAQNDDLFKNANWADDLDDEEEVVTVNEIFPVDQQCASVAATVPNKQAALQSDGTLVSSQVKTAESYAETREVLKLTPCFRPVISGTDGFRFKSVFAIQKQPELHTEFAKEVSVLAPNFNSRFFNEIEDQERYSPGSGTTSSNSSSFRGIYTSSTSGPSLHAEEPAIDAADSIDALQERPQKGVGADDNFFSEPAASCFSSMESSIIPTISLTIRKKLAELVSPRLMTLRIRSRRVNPSAMETLEPPIHANNIFEPAHNETPAKSEEESITIASELEPDQRENEQEARENPFNVVFRNELDGQEEQLITKEESDGNIPRTPLKQVLAAAIMPTSPAESPPEWWHSHPVIVSPLSCKKSRSHEQKRSVTSEHKNLITPKISLFPDSMVSMVKSQPFKLKEIKEEDEEKTDNENLFNIGAHYDEITDDEGEVIEKIKIAISKGHVMLRRSPFVEDLSLFVEDESASEPATSEKSPVPSPQKCPASNTLNVMLGKKLHLSLPRIDGDSSSAEELVGTRGIGAIFEDDGEIGDIGSIFCSAGPYDDDDNVIRLQPGIASRPFTILPELATSSKSTTIADDIFTAPSASLSTPTTVETRHEGSPPPSVVAPARKCPLPGAEPWPERPVREEPVVQKRKSSWAPIKKNSMRKNSSGGFTAAVDVQFTPVRHRTSSWTKIQNKLQKLKPVTACQVEKKHGGVRKAMKKVKDALAKSVKALA